LEISRVAGMFTAKKTVTEATVLKNETKPLGDSFVSLATLAGASPNQNWKKILPFYDPLMPGGLERLRTIGNKLFIYIRMYVSVVTEFPVV